MKYLVIAVMMLAIATFAYAETTGGQQFYSPNGSVPQGFVNFLNDQEYLDHNHQYESYEPNWELGLGADITVIETAGGLAPDTVELQTKYDFNNENGSVYLVGQWRAPWLNGGE